MIFPHFQVSRKEYFGEKTGILFMVCQENWVSQLGKSARYSLWPFLPCLHYKKIIRNIVINLIIKNQNIFTYIYISRDQPDETRVNIYIKNKKKTDTKYNPIYWRLFNNSKHKEKLVKLKFKSGLSWISTTTKGLSQLYSFV